VIIEILLHVYFEYVLDIVVLHILFSNKHCWTTMCNHWLPVQLHCLIFRWDFGAIVIFRLDLGAIRKTMISTNKELVPHSIELHSVKLNVAKHAVDSTRRSEAPPALPRARKQIS